MVFANGNELTVDNAVRAESPNRVKFRITSARLVLKRPFAFELRFPYPPPPVGGEREGHVDVVYADDTLKVTRDSRGDLLIIVIDESTDARGLAW